MRKLTYREIVREFLLFLKTEHVYKRYITLVKTQRKSQIKNWENSINILTISSIKQCFKNSGHLCNLIDYAFHWASTTEGHEFWLALNDKWRDKVKDVEIVAEKINKL